LARGTDKKATRSLEGRRRPQLASRWRCEKNSNQLNPCIQSDDIGYNWPNLSEARSMKIKQLRARRSLSGTSSASRALLLFVVVTAAFSVASANSSLAQGLPGTYEDPAKPKKAPISLAARQNPAQIKPDSSKLGSEGLSSCNQMEAKQLGLRSPGGKSLVQFDKCYRGRLHNICLAKALSGMISSLQHDYEKLVETNYPSIASASAVCAFKLSQLSDDFETSKAFHARYKALVDGYDERLKCTDLVLKALEKATFPDLPNIEKTVKTMADELKNDVAQFAKERQGADELLAKITDAQKALEVHMDVHRAMCITADAGLTRER
jgi:hypothetical protein